LSLADFSGDWIGRGRDSKRVVPFNIDSNVVEFQSLASAVLDCSFSWFLGETTRWSWRRWKEHLGWPCWCLCRDSLVPTCWEFGSGCCCCFCVVLRMWILLGDGNWKCVDCRVWMFDRGIQRSGKGGGYFIGFWLTGI
jgi:hypothetical protein